MIALSPSSAAHFDFIFFNPPPPFQKKRGLWQKMGLCFKVWETRQKQRRYYNEKVGIGAAWADVLLALA